MFPLILAFPVIGQGCSVSTTDGGVYKTVDGGEKWNQEVTIEDNKATLADSNTTKLLADPNNSDVVFMISANQGLFVSNKFGDSWKRILPETSTVYDIDADPFNQGSFYASVLLNNRGKIIASNNGGTDWNEIYTETGKGSYLTAVKADPFIKDSLLAVNSGGLLIRSLDRGNTWKPMFPFNEPVINLVVDKEMAGSLWVLTQKGVWHSVNGGIDFQHLELNSEMGYSFSLLQKERGRLFLQTDKGLFQSADDGNVWEKIVTLNNPSEFPVNTISFFPGASDRKWAIGAGMTLYITEDDGISFKAIQFDLSREVGSILVKSNDPNQILVGVKVINRNKLGVF